MNLNFLTVFSAQVFIIFGFYWFIFAVYFLSVRLDTDGMEFLMENSLPFFLYYTIKVCIISNSELFFDWFEAFPIKYYVFLVMPNLKIVSKCIWDFWREIHY